MHWSDQTGRSCWTNLTHVLSLTQTQRIKGHTENHSSTIFSHIHSSAPSHTHTHTHTHSSSSLTLSGLKPQTPQTAIVTSPPLFLSAGSSLHVVKLTHTHTHTHTAVWPYNQRRERWLFSVLYDVKVNILGFKMSKWEIFHLWLWEYFMKNLWGRGKKVLQH